MNEAEQTVAGKSEPVHSGFNQCPNCKSTMPPEMRFCRSCGYRLGEGLSEYTETVRLSGPPPPRPAGTRSPLSTTNGFPFSDPGAPRPYAPVAPQPPGGPLFSQPNPAFDYRYRRRRRRMPWYFWMVVAVSLTAIPAVNRRYNEFGVSRPRSFIGANLASAQNGALIQSASTPNGAIDKAGMIGGDVVTSFDGKPVQNESDLRRLLESTPIGKTVDVMFTRDGAPHTTKLTTLSEGEFNSLGNAFNSRPEGKGKLGINIGEQVDVPGQNIKGVRISSVDKNNPGYIAGLLKDDIVTEFDGTPIRTPDEFRVRIERAFPRHPTVMKIVRAGIETVIPITPGQR